MKLNDESYLSTGFSLLGILLTAETGGFLAGLLVVLLLVVLLLVVLFLVVAFCVVVVRLVVRLVVLLVGRRVVVVVVADGEPLSAAPLASGEVEMQVDDDNDYGEGSHALLKGMKQKVQVGGGVQFVPKMFAIKNRAGEGGQEPFETLLKIPPFW